MGSKGFETGLAVEVRVAGFTSGGAGLSAKAFHRKVIVPAIKFECHACLA